MKVQIINLGRNNVNKEVYVKDIEALKREISRHVIYDDWTLEESRKEDNEYYVIHGMDVIGAVKILKH